MSTSQSTRKLLRAPIAAFGLIAIVLANHPAQAGILDKIKRAAMKELKAAAEQKLETVAPSISEIVVTKSTDAASAAIMGGGSTSDADSADDIAADAAEPEQAVLITLLLPAVQKVRAPLERSSISLNYTKIEYSYGNVSVGDVDGDGTADVVIGAAACGDDGSVMSTEELLSDTPSARRAGLRKVIEAHDLDASCAAAIDIAGEAMETASDVIAEQGSDEPAIMLLPAVQNVTGKGKASAAAYIKFDGVEGAS